MGQDVGARRNISDGHGGADHVPGERHVAGTRLEHEATFYERLRTPLLNPFAANGAAAETSHDVYSFGVCALEMLATKTVARVPVFYNELREVVHGNSTAFAEPWLAGRIADALSLGSEAGWLLKLFTELDQGLGLNAEQWLGVG